MSKGLDRKSERDELEKKLTKKKLLKAKLNKLYSKLFSKERQELYVFDYKPENKNSDNIENFLKLKSLEISNSTDFSIIGWNKNHIFFLKEKNYKK
jgi:hypothetical protein